MNQVARKSTRMCPLPALQWQALLAVVLIMAGCGYRGGEQANDLQQDELPGTAFEEQSGQQAIGAAVEVAGTVVSDSVGSRFDTPQACFEALLKAVRERDSAAMLGCYVRRYQKERIGRYMLDLDREVIFSRAHAAAAEQLLKDRGIKVGETMKLLQNTESGLTAVVQGAYVKLGGLIDRREQFAGEAAKLISKPLEPPFPDLVDAEFLDQRVGPNYALVRYRNPDSDEKIPLMFQRQKGSWLITPYVKLSKEDNEVLGAFDR